MEYYAEIGKSEAHIFEPYQATLHPEYIRMEGPPTTINAIAQADGTWLEPEPVDISMAEADNLKILFPVSYPGILAHIGMGDIV